jgi:hypothetical protein
MPENAEYVPALFEVDNDLGEATGTTYRFCSTACRDQFTDPHLPVWAHLRADEEDILSVPEHWCCDTCGVALFTQNDSSESEEA